MKVRSLRSFYGDGRHVRRGTILDVTDYRGAQLIRKGLATEVQASAPLGSGGRTGTAKSSSSSQAGRQPKTSTSKRDEDKPASSRSTPRGDSARGETRSTPATTHGGSDTAASRNSED